MLIPLPNSIHFPKNLNPIFGLLGFAAAAAAVAALYASSTKKKPMRRIKKETKKSLIEFRTGDLAVATDDYTVYRFQGAGHSGHVYRATWEGVEYAVKRYRPQPINAALFFTELTTNIQLNHKNLLSLRGWCADGYELAVVHDFMINGSLDFHLRGIGANNMLNWARRYSVVTELASALTYMHHCCQPPVVHGNVRIRNVMLDADYSVKLKGFEKAVIGEEGGDSEVMDVFWFGFLVLEICCGRWPHDAQGTFCLVKWVWRLFSEGRLIEAADRRLGVEFDREEMETLLLVGLSCTDWPSWPVRRPTMARILKVLKGEAEPLAIAEAPRLHLCCLRR